MGRCLALPTVRDSTIRSFREIRIFSIDGGDAKGRGGELLLRSRSKLKFMLC
jgi:hypothetical protein